MILVCGGELDAQDSLRTVDYSLDNTDKQQCTWTLMTQPMKRINIKIQFTQFTNYECTETPFEVSQFRL